METIRTPDFTFTVSNTLANAVRFDDHFQILPGGAGLGLCGLPVRRRRWRQ